MNTFSNMVKISNKKVMELLTKIIAESIYAHCDVGSNKYLLLKLFVDQRKNDRYLSVEEHKIVVKDEKTVRGSTAT